MIKTNNGNIKVKGDKVEIGADICYIIVKMVEIGIFTFDEVEHLLQVAKENT